MKWYLHGVALLVLWSVQFGLGWAYPWIVRSGLERVGILHMLIVVSVLLYTVVLVVIARGILWRLAVVVSYVALSHAQSWIPSAEQRYREQYIVPLRHDHSFQEYMEKLRNTHLIVTTSSVPYGTLLDSFRLKGAEGARRQEFKVFGAASHVYVWPANLQGKRYLEFLSSPPLRQMTLNIFRSPADAPLALRDDEAGWINDHVYFCFGRIYGRGELADETKDTESDSDSGTEMRVETNAPLRP